MGEDKQVRGLTKGARRLIRKLVDIPAELRAVANWATWQYDRRGEDILLVSIDSKTGAPASMHDRSTWSTFEDAARRFHSDENLAGIGFMLDQDSGFTCIDLEGSIPDGGKGVPAYKDDICAVFKTWIELSPSREGMTLWMRAKMPEAKVRRLGLDIFSRDMFVPVTTRRVPGTPRTIMDCQHELNELLAGGDDWHVRAILKHGGDGPKGRRRR